VINNKYTKFGQLIIRKIIATRCHILRLKCTKFDSLRLSVHPSVLPSLKWSSTLICYTININNNTNSDLI